MTQKLLGCAVVLISCLISSCLAEAAHVQSSLLLSESPTQAQKSMQREYAVNILPNASDEEKMMMKSNITDTNGSQRRLLACTGDYCKYGCTISQYISPGYTLTITQPGIYYFRFDFSGENYNHDVSISIGSYSATYLEKGCIYDFRGVVGDLTITVKRRSTYLYGTSVYYGLTYFSQVSDGASCSDTTYVATPNDICKSGFCNSKGTCGYLADGSSCGSSNDCSSKICNSKGTCGSEPAGGGAGGGAGGEAGGEAGGGAGAGVGAASLAQSTFGITAYVWYLFCVVFVQICVDNF